MIHDFEYSTNFSPAKTRAKIDDQKFSLLLQKGVRLSESLESRHLSVLLASWERKIAIFPLMQFGFTTKSLCLHIDGEKTSHRKEEERGKEAVLAASAGSFDSVSVQRFTSAIRLRVRTSWTLCVCAGAQSDLVQEDGKVEETW